MRIHGAMLMAINELGPKFPVEAKMRTLCWASSKDLMAIESRSYGGDRPLALTDSEIMSMPLAIA